MTVVYIGVGANTGDRQGNIEMAAVLLEKKGIRVTRVSPIYETEAVCKPGQRMPPFLNAAFEIETGLEPEALRELLEGVERAMGRYHKGGWQPRPIDLDILFYGDRVIDSERLKVPHPDAATRWFVLKPLSDIAPDLVHPVLKRTVRDLLQAIPV